MNRRSAGSVDNELRDLWKKKWAEGNAAEGYRLTQTGFDAAVVIIQKILKS